MAAARVDHAAELADRALEHDDDHPASGRPSAASLAAARDLAAQALDELAAAPARPPQVQAQSEAKPRIAPDPELNLGPAHAAAAQDLARRERRIREGVQAILGPARPTAADRYVARRLPSAASWPACAIAFAHSAIRPVPRARGCPASGRPLAAGHGSGGRAPGPRPDA